MRVGEECVVEIELPRLDAAEFAGPTADVDFLVTDASTGFPIERAEVEVYAQFGATDLNLRTITTDADGRARGKLLAADSYLLYVDGPSPNAPPYEWRFEPVKRVVKPVEGVVRADFTLRLRSVH